LDESADVANLAILLVFVRYIKEDTCITEELLFCRPLKERTTGEDTSVFNLTNAFVENEMDWSRCIGICTSVTGKLAGFVARTKEVATNVS
jgi:hypothetical protein